MPSIIKINIRLARGIQWQTLREILGGKKFSTCMPLFQNTNSSFENMNSSFENIRIQALEIYEFKL